MEDLLAVGVIASSFGTRGWCKIKYDADNADHFREIKNVYVETTAGLRTYPVEEVEVGTGRLLMKLAGIMTPEDVKRMVGNRLWVDRKYAQALGEGEYYTRDLYGCQLVFAGKTLGTIAAVMENGAQALLEVETSDGKRHLVPLVEHFIGGIDIGRRRIELKEDYILR
ncbi:MAG TPA: 16S rRNA processing protein RimM [Spirochaetia bacterium]|nr:16S rRNA processing protein RimM [Spirochaetia bacterium]